MSVCGREGDMYELFDAAEQGDNGFSDPDSVKTIWAGLTALNTLLACRHWLP